MTDSNSTLLQICPSDSAPFGDICDAYAAAAASLGATTHTVFLTPPTTEPRQTPFHTPHYLRGSVHHFACAQEMVPMLPTTTPTLALCHRYRSHRVLRRSRIRPTQKIVLAHEYGMLRRWQRRLSRRWFARDYQFAGVAPAVARELAGVTGQGLVLPNGIDQAAVAASLVTRDDARLALGITPTPALVLGVVGRLHHKKQPGLAIQGLEKLLAADVDAHLVFVGDGALRPQLEQQAQGLPVTFSGFTRDVRRYFRAFDALLMTSAPVEAFGLVALEGLATGVPVITPDVPGPRSVLGELGFYYEFDDTLTSLAQALAEAATLTTNTAQLEQWQSAATQRVTEQFSITAIAEHLRPFLVDGQPPQS